MRDATTALELSQCHLHQRVTVGSGCWTISCYLWGVRSQSGFTLTELLIALAVAGVLAAISVPVVMESTARNRLWTGSELIGAQIRQARLKAITRNTTFQVRFNCPAVGQFRSLVMTGDVAIDNHVDRCRQTRPFDSGVQALPANITSTPANTIQVTGRGIVSVVGAAVPHTISVSYGASTRTLIISATGQITFSTF
jgi:prepilin-type N-terminal cleavage/methylation domain-containing protein